MFDLRLAPSHPHHRDEVLVAFLFAGNVRGRGEVPHGAKYSPEPERARSLSCSLSKQLQGEGGGLGQHFPK